MEILEAYDLLRTFVLKLFRKMNTDYSDIKNVLLAYPERFYNEYERLVPFFDLLIEIIPKDFQIWIVSNNQSSIQKLKDKFFYKRISFIGLNGWDEIWLRDCIGIKKGEEIIKPYYQPSYCNYGSNIYANYYYRINKLSKTIIKEGITNKIRHLPLKIDGGNFVNNDRIVFLTDKVLVDNKQYTRSEIIQIIKEFTGLHAIIVPGNKSDDIGHMDAYLAFLGASKVCIASYPSLPFLKYDIEFIYSLRKAVEEEKLEIVEVLDRPVDEIVTCSCFEKTKVACFYSARGNYVNYLKLNNTILLPEYTLPTIKETKYYNSANRELFESQGYDVITINCDQLSKLGGSLHCITYTF